MSDTRLDHIIHVIRPEGGPAGHAASAEDRWRPPGRAARSRLPARRLHSGRYRLWPEARLRSGIGCPAVGTDSVTEWPLSRGADQQFRGTATSSWQTIRPPCSRRSADRPKRLCNTMSHQLVDARPGKSSVAAPWPTGTSRPRSSGRPRPPAGSIVVARHPHLSAFVGPGRALPPTSGRIKANRYADAASIELAMSTNSSVGSLQASGVLWWRRSPGDRLDLAGRRRAATREISAVVDLVDSESASRTGG